MIMDYQFDYQVKRGNKAFLPLLKLGELGLCTDVNPNELYIGTVNGNLMLYPANGSGGSVQVLDSIINGNIIVNGKEIKIYDDVIIKNTLAEKANSIHTHVVSNITDLQSILDSKSETAHTHKISTITSLQNELDSKSPLIHNHTISNITNLQTTLDSKASSIHSHVVSDITGLQSTLDNKAVLSHVHTIANVSNLQTTLDEKANIAHIHSLSNIFDLDVTNKSNGYAIQYDSTVGKFMSKALPLGLGEGATSLDGLTDVDVSSDAPIDGSVLKYEGGIWKPSVIVARDIIFEDFDTTAGQSVKILKPYPISNLQQTPNKTITSIELQWTASTSPDVTYNIYNNDILVGDTSMLKFTIEDLDADTLYTFKVRALNAANYESDERSITAKTKGNYYYANIRSAGNYIDVPSITFTSLEIVCSIDTKFNSWDNRFIYLRNNTGTSVYSQHSGLEWRVTGLFKRFYVDGVQQTDNAPNNIPANKKIVLRLEANLDQPITSSMVLFANLNYIEMIKANIYELRVYNRTLWEEEKLVSIYDFSYLPVSKLIPDNLGNNQPLTYHNGTFNFVEEV